MANFKKLLSSVSVAALVATQAMTAVVYWANGLNDEEFTKSLSWMYENGLTKYNTEDAFRPLESLTREQAAKFYAESAKLAWKTADTTKDCTFTDLNEADQSLTWSIVEACQLGLFKGSNGKFMPTAPLTKAAALTVLVRSTAGDQDENVDPWWSNYFTKAKELGLTKESDVWALDRAVTRYEIALMLNRSANPSSEGGDDLGDLLGGLLGDDTSTDSSNGTWATTDTTDTTDDTAGVVGTNLEVALNPNTPAYSRLPKNADGVVAAIYDLTAGEADAKIDSVTLKRVGDGAANGVSTAAIFTDAGRVSKIKTFSSSDDTAVVYFDPALVVKAGETKSVKVVVSAGSTQWAQFAVSLTAVAGNVEVASDLPVTANTLEVGTTTASPLTLTSTGSITNPKLGEKAVEVAKFKLKNNTSNQEDITIKSITLKEDGTADEQEHLMNFKLLVAGTEVASAERMTSKYLSFNLGNGYKLKESKSEEFKVTADVVGWAQKTISFQIEKGLDIVAEASKYGNVDVSITDGTALQSTTIQAWDLTLVSTDPTVTQVRKDKQDVIFGKIKVTANAGKDLELQKFKVTIAAVNTSHAAGVADAIQNVELYDETNGNVYDLPSVSTSGTGTVVFGDLSLNIPFKDGGTVTYAIRADTINTGGSAGLKLASSVSTSSNGFYVVETSDDQQVTDITPSSMTFKTMEIVSSAATLTVLPLSDSKNAVIGSKDIEALSFEVKADDSSDLVIKDIKVSKDSWSGSLNSTYVSEIKLYKDSVAEANLLSRKSGSSLNGTDVTFDWLSVKVAKNAKAKFVVAVSLVDASANDGYTLKLEVASASDVTVEDEDNDDVTVSGTATSARLITIKGTGTLTAVVDNTNSKVDNKKNVVANTTSAEVAAFKLTATNEGIKVKDVNVVASWSTFTGSIAEVVLVDANGNEIKRETVSSSNTVTFDNINYVVKEGSETIFAKVVTRKIGKDSSGVQSSDIQLWLSVTDADGNESNKTIKGWDTSTSISSSNAITTSNSKEFAVLPVRVSNVAFVSSQGGETVNSKLSNGINNTLAIIAVTTDSSTNTDTDGDSLKTLLKSIKLNVQFSSGTAVDTYTIDRIGGSSSDSTVAWVESSTGSTSEVVTFTTSSFTSDDEITNGTTAYYVVKWLVTLQNNADISENVQVKFGGFSDSQVLYSSDHATYSASNVTDLRLGLTSLDWSIISK